jgi:hypothetical protein
MEYGGPEQMLSFDAHATPVEVNTSAGIIRIGAQAIDQEPKLGKGRCRQIPHRHNSRTGEYGGYGEDYRHRRMIWQLQRFAR